jgi:hypothetical protein
LAVVYKRSSIGKDDSSQTADIPSKDVSTNDTVSKDIPSKGILPKDSSTNDISADNDSFMTALDEMSPQQQQQLNVVSLSSGSTFYFEVLKI